ncbi:hypothetical protein [Cupriavidus necator]|uniref:hypothetical protein n=1 Tax=Cupriavidus necator TaxID=106590 RepID=UPI00339D87A5
MGLMNFLTRSATKMAAVTLSKKYTDDVIVMEVGYNVCRQLASQLGNKLAEEAMVRMQKEEMDTDGELTGYECALIKLAWIFRHDNLQSSQREAVYELCAVSPRRRLGAFENESPSTSQRRSVLGCWN